MVLVASQPASVAILTDDSLATLAHELRDPLATILLALETITTERPGNPTVRQATLIAENQARRAVQIIEDVFDVCAGFRDRLTIHKESVDLATVVAVATQTVAHRIAERAHRLTVSLPAEPVYLFADSLRLEQVLTNLLGNAAKFTDPGGHIRLTGEIESGQVVIRVRDNGRGIDQQRLPGVFDTLRQDDIRPSPGIGGLGIGLALVKSLVELHGGSVAAFSDGPLTGAEFVVRLPAGAADPGN